MRPTSKEVKRMAFFDSLDWDNLLLMEPPFIPQPENATDTGYFEGTIEWHYTFDHELNLLIKIKKKYFFKFCSSKHFAAPKSL